MPNGEHVVHPTAAAAPRSLLRRISWGGVFAGVVAVLLIQLILLLLGLAVAGGKTAATQSLRGVGVGAGIWWILSGVIAAFFGAMVASRLASVPNKTDGTLNGLVSWATAQLVAMALAATALGTLISGAGNVLAGSMQAAGQGRGIGVYGYVQPETGAPTTQPAGQVGQQAGEAARQAQQTIEGQKPEQVEEAGKATALVAVWALLTLLLSGAAAAIGGSIATPRTFLVVPGSETDIGTRV